MKPQDRVKLINEIAYKLQDDMQLTGIKSYFFTFGVNCNNFNASYNSKRVFVEEVLSSVENDIILKIGTDLKLVNTLNKNLEVIINKFYAKFIQYQDDFNDLQTYLPFYENITPINLSHLFAYFHFSINSLFEFMNNKMEVNGHFNAEESRRLKYLIENIEKLLKSLDKIDIRYSINDNYKKLINRCKDFLVVSGGSSIPEDFESIEIIEFEPIFTSSKVIKVNKYNFDIKHIGGGSYAEVFKYKDTFYNKIFVIKKAKNNLIEKEVIRFKREFETMKTLNSPYILEVYNFNKEDNSYVMEFCRFYNW